MKYLPLILHLEDKKHSMKKNLFSGIVTAERAVVTLPRIMKDKQGNNITQLTLLPVKAEGNAFLKQSNMRGGSVMGAFLDFINKHIEEENIDAHMLNLNHREVDYLLAKLHELSYGQVLWQLLSCPNEKCKNHGGFKESTYINIVEGNIDTFLNATETAWVLNTVENDGAKFVQLLEATNVFYKTEGYVITGLTGLQVSAKEMEQYQDAFSKEDMTQLKKLFRSKIKHLHGYKTTEFDAMLQKHYENDYPGLVPQHEDTGTYKGKRLHYKNVLVPVELLTSSTILDEFEFGMSALFITDVFNQISTIPLLIQHCVYDVPGLFVRTVTTCRECNATVDMPVLNHAGICNPVLGLDTSE